MPSIIKVFQNENTKEKEIPTNNYISSSFIDRIKNDSNFIKVSNPVGVYLKNIGTHCGRSSFCFFLTGNTSFLNLIDKKYATVCINHYDYDAKMNGMANSEVFEEMYTSVLLSPFYVFVKDNKEIHDNPNPYIIADEQIKFINHFKVDFIITEKNVSLNPKLKDIIFSEFSDTISGSKLFLVDKKKLL